MNSGWIETAVELVVEIEASELPFSNEDFQDVVVAVQKKRPRSHLGKQLDQMWKYRGVDLSIARE